MSSKWSVATIDGQLVGVTAAGAVHIHSIDIAGVRK